MNSTLAATGRGVLPIRCDQRLGEGGLLFQPCAHMVDERRLQFVLEGSGDGYWDWDVQTGHVEVNRRWWELRGRTVGLSPKITVDDWKSSVHTDDLMATLASLEAHLSGTADSFHAEYRVLRPDGSQLWVSDRGRVVARDADGRPVRVCGVNSDIDAHHRTAAELASSHRMLTAVQQLQREFIRTRDLRQQAEQMLSLAIATSGAGYGFIAEVLRDSSGQPYLKTHAMTNIAWDAATEALYEEHLAKGLEFRNLNTLFGHSLRTGETVITNDPAHDPRRSGTPGGHPPMRSYLGVPIFSGEHMVGMLALANGPGGFTPALVRQLEPLLSTFAVMLQAQNVERERTHAILRATEAESRLRRVTDGVPGAVFQCTATGGRLSRLGFLSDGVHRLIGLAAGDLMAQPRRLLHCLDRNERRALRCMVTSSARSGLPWAFEFRPKGPEAERRWLRIAAQCSHLGADTYEWNGMIVDITEQKRVESDLRQARDAADSANRAKSSFLATMSHEIRTPMHAMLGFLELLDDSSLDPSRAEKVHVVREAGQSLLGLIDDILDFSRIEAGHVEIRDAAVDVSALLERKFEVWVEAARSKGLALQIHVDPSAASSFMLDELRVRQVLRNLLSNAIKFTERGRVVLAASCEGDHLLFRVIDTGIGVDPDSQERVFSPFEQADGETTRRFGGSGLGLSISRRLASLMGGSLIMHSQAGQGTEMVLDLPARPVQAVAKPFPSQQALSPPVRASVRVLVAEDHPVNRMLMRQQLERLGLQAEIAADGAQALELWHRGSYEVLIADCHMPGMDGFELARSIRDSERHELGRVPLRIIACTADVLPETVDACRASGMDDFIAKPVSLSVLASKLDTHLRSPATARAAATLNLEKLDALSGGDRGLRQLALQLFRETLPDDIAALDAAIAKGDDERLRRECHRLLGLVGTVGADALGSAIEALQLMARAGQASGREPLQETIHDRAADALLRAQEELAA